jgi:hypothetical protein
MKHRITIDLEVITDGDHLTIAGDHKIDPVPETPHPAVDLMHHLVGAIRGFMLERGEELRVKSNAEILREYMADENWVEMMRLAEREVLTGVKGGIGPIQRPGVGLLTPAQSVPIPAGFQVYKGGKNGND